jgi:hypothetical protein
MAMTSRERVLAALNHREPDRVPIDFGAMRSTGIMAVEYNRLKKHLHRTEGPTFVYDLFQQLAEPESWVLDLFHADVVQLHRLRPAFGFSIAERRHGELPDGSPCTYPADFQPVPYREGEAIMDEDRLFAYRPKDGLVFYQEFHPFKGVRSIDGIDPAYLPSMEDDEFAYLTAQSRRLRQSTDRAILGAFGGNVIEEGQFDFGYEEFLTLMATEKKTRSRLLRTFDRGLDSIPGPLHRSGRGQHRRDPDGRRPGDPDEPGDLSPDVPGDGQTLSPGHLSSREREGELSGIHALLRLDRGPDSGPDRSGCGGAQSGADLGPRYGPGFSQA